MKLRNISRNVKSILWLTAIGVLGVVSSAVYATTFSDLNEENKNLVKNSQVAKNPLNIAATQIPTFVMIVLGRDHNLFTEAYNDYIDLDPTDEVELNIMFDPSFNYYGLFDSNLCYTYDSDMSKLKNKDDRALLGFFYPSAQAQVKNVSLSLWNGATKQVKYCDSKWSGNFLNYVTSSRLDVIRKVLYGGTRMSAAAWLGGDDGANTSTPQTTYNGAVLLKHSNVLTDAHSWGKVFAPAMYDHQLTFKDFMGETPKDGANAAFFGMASYDDDKGDYNKTRAGFMRLGWVANPGLPGELTDSDDFQNKTFIWDWASVESDYTLLKENSSLFIGSSTSDFSVHVAVCTNEYHGDDSCYNYGDSNNPIWRPIGILQQYELNAQNAIKFGLITGSWKNNIEKGALRANIGDFSKEVLQNVTSKQKNEGRNIGDFSYKSVSCSKGKLCGFVTALDQMRIVQKTKGDSSQYNDCKRDNAGEYLNPTVGPINGENCTDWGNPVSKLLYQSAMYFKNSNGTVDKGWLDSFEDSLDLGSVDYKNPYAGDNYYCADPVSLVIADESITYDGKIGSKDYSLSSDVVSQTSAIKVSGTYLMGYSDKDKNSDYNFYPTLKSIDNLGQVGGVAPAVAQSYGSYNVAGVAKYFAENKFFTAVGDSNKSQDHNMESYFVAMKPNMPEIKIPLDDQGNVATIVPIAASPLLSGSAFTAVNQVVDFYVEYLGDNEGVFRVNFEDYQFGADYDMDWIVEYYYKVITGSDNNKYIRIQLRDVISDGYANQRAGYVITGVDNPGVFFDLAKPSAGFHTGSENSAEKVNFMLDNPVQDIALLECPNNITPENLTTCMKVGKDGSVLKLEPNNAHSEEGVYPRIGACYRSQSHSITSDDFGKDDKRRYKESIDTPDKIVKHYENIEKIKEYYYANRKELINTFPVFDIKKENWSVKTAMYSLVGTNTRCTEYDDLATSSRVFKINSANGNDVWLKSPLWYAAQYGLDLDQTSLPANQDPINYFLVTNPSKLKEGITRMLEQIKKSVHSASSFSTESTSTQAGDFVYATQYEPSTWWGEVIKTTITSSGIDFGGYSEFNDTNIQWKASEQFENAKIEDRLVVALNENHELTRIYADDSKSAYDSLGEDLFETISGQTLNGATPTADLDKYMTRFVRWYLGEHDYENSGSSNNEDLVYGSYNDGLPLRSRISSFGSFVLGDVIDSDAVMFTSNGKKFVVVGANDGMLHFIDAANGKPVLSYVPTVMLPDIKNLAKQDWVKTHTYMVNSTPRIYYKGDKVYIYGTYGVAYPGGYALDVTDLSTLSSTSVGDSFKVLWELKPSDSSMVGNMPYPPSIMSVGTDDYLIYSSGYPTSDVEFKNGIFVVDMFNKDSCINQKDGESMDNKACIIKEISLDKGYYRKGNGDLNEETVSDPWGIGRKNAIGPVSLVQLNATLNTYEAIYAGDYFGNLWKIDINGKEIDAWEKPTILFKAVDNSGTAQPITARIGVGHVNNGVMLIFGTGSYVRDIDNQQVSKDYNDYQSIYAIRDMTTMYSASSLNNELKRCGAEGTSENAPCLSKVESDGATGSSVTNADGSTSISYLREFKITKGSPNVGWFLDLGGRATSEKGESVPNTGERVYTDPLIIGTDAYLTLNIPNVDDPCLGAGVSSLFRTSLLTGVVQEVAKYESLAKSPTVTIHEGDIVIHVPLDPVGPTNPDGGDPQVENIKLNSLPSKQSSIIKLY